MRSVSHHLWIDQHGVVLAMTLILMGLMSAMAAAYSTLIRADTVVRGAAGRERQGFYAAEAGLNLSMADVRNNFISDTLSTTADVSFDVGTRTVRYVVEPSSANPGPGTIVPSGLSFAGLSTDPSHFSVTSVAENTEGDTEALLGAQFTVHTVPIFRFLAFYNDTLEILPEQQSMNLTGRIHTNGDLYLDDALTIDDDDNPSNPYVQVSAAGSIYRGRKHDATCSGTVTIDKLEDGDTNGSLDSRVLSCVGGASAEVSTTTIAAYQGSVLSDVTPIQLLDIDTTRGSTDSDSFWQKADLRIVLRLDAARASINFNTAALCQNGPGDLTSPLLYPIEVWDAGGTNGTKTNQLLVFMCQQRGAIFYNDVPNNTAAPADTIYANTATNYTPPFGDTNANDVLDSAASPPEVPPNIYRRVGVDTGGDGIIDRDGNGAVTNSDQNLDICPYGAGARPFWRPDYCDNPPLGAWPPAGAPATTSWYYDTDYRRGGFYNRREQKWVYMLNVNLRALIEWNASNGDALFDRNDATDGGLVIFLSVQGPYSTTAPASSPVRYGVRVFDAADLDILGNTLTSNPADPAGLTVVSDQAVYIQGNYNSADKVPAAVIGDTINVLSQSWEVKRVNNGLANDRKTTNTLASDDRDVLAADGFDFTGGQCGDGNDACQSFTTTTALGINAALIAGASATTGSSYGGGLENHLRFHEDWNPGTARTLNFQGSLVGLGEPHYASGSWCGMGSTCNIYDEPIRNWDYDVAFDLDPWLPPLTPEVDILQQRVYTRF